MTSRKVSGIAVVVGGVAAVVLAGYEGTVIWQVMRVALVSLTAAGVVHFVRDGSRIRPIVAFAAGTMAIIFGVGVGVMHAVKSDINVAAVAALILLFCGFVLLFGATWDLLRRVHWPLRLLAVPAAFLLLEFVFLPLVPAVYATNVPATSIGDSTPADRGMPYEDVQLRTSDNVRLATWYVPSRNRAAVVLLHGAGSTRADV
jgi:lysylphosphatidylglycerol synthetase-like protein (DUF2156 family)